MRLFLALLFLSFSSSAQFELSGYIRDTHGHPLSSANVYLRKKGNTAIEGFAISAANGQYSVLLKLSQADTLLLSVSKIGYQTLERTVVYTTRQLDFVLQKGDITLKEVVVKPPAVRRYGDTLSYNVSDFQVESDRSIGDVIARMPGISIDENGRIKYQGKPINRYYIDNLNLLDNRYGLVNNNLPYDKVLSVEVFENHQPIRILDSLVMSETAAPEYPA